MLNVRATILILLYSVHPYIQMYEKQIKIQLKNVQYAPAWQHATGYAACGGWKAKSSQAKLLKTILCINPEVAKNCLFMRPP